MDLTFEGLQLEPIVVLLLAQRLLVLSDSLFLGKFALLSVLLNFFASGLELVLILLLAGDLLSVGVTLVLLEGLVKLLEVDGVLDNKSLKSGFLLVLFTEFSLHIFEKAAGKDLDVYDFDGGEMHSPSLNDFTHFIEHLLSDLLTILDDVVDGRVGNLIANDCAGHAGQSIIGNPEASTGEVKILVSLKREVSIDGPLDHRHDFDTLHLFGDLLGAYFDLHKTGRELSN